tara:strand:- start:1746 stop:2687 length:942 start_codon:yes stop_codon:yes gene_type:complete
MAGILDVKRRIMDAIITVDGRRQMASNVIDLSFATFSDEGLFYDSVDGKSARDISDLPILEVMSLPRDTIIPEVDDDGAFSLNLADGNKIVHGRKVISGALDTIQVDENGARSVIKVESVLTGTINVYSGALDVIRTAKKHFQQLNVLKTDDGLLDSAFRSDVDRIDLSTREIEASLSTLSPLMFDDSINHIINTRYLPPEVTTDENKSIPLGDYPKFTKEPYNNFESFEQNELANSISFREINFTTSGRANNLLGQVFEIGENSTTKLTIVDYGEFVDEFQNRYRVFYLGKPLRDANGTPKFCKLFTLVFEK